MEDDEMILYWVDGSPSCWRVTIALQEKNLSGKCKRKHIDFAIREHKSEEILRMNPRGQVPTFKHGKVVINESLATIQYLEETFKDQGNRLIANESTERAPVLQRMIESLNLHRRTEDAVYYALTQAEDFSQKRMATLKEDVLKEIDLWELYLGQRNDKNESYLAGDFFSLADVAFFPYFAFVVHHGLQLEDYPYLAMYYSVMCKRPSIQTEWPSGWKQKDEKPVVPKTFFVIKNHRK